MLNHGGLTQALDARTLEDENARLSARVQQLEAERDELAGQQQALEDFAAMAAHEVLKPLVLTEACAGLISDRLGHALDLDSRRDLDAMVRVSSRVRLLVEALLVDAREQTRPMRRQAVDLSKVVDECLELLDADIRARDARVAVEPLPVVAGNAQLLGGVFGNLLSNALKYGPREGGEIRVSVERSDAGWTFAVQSPGATIPEPDRKRIFEPWERGRDERRTRGAGLGLTIVRQIVERHGGHVGVTAPAGSGNRFFFTLPA